MSKEIQKRLKSFYNNLADRPLEPSDEYYVPFLEKHPGDPIKNLRTKINWSEASSLNLLTGQRGSGKSTEFRRLKKYLEEDGCIVFLCNMQGYLNLTTSIEITDFFISMMGALSIEVKDKYGTDPSQEGFWKRFVKFLNTEVKIKDLSVEMGIESFKTSLTASLKDDPSFRERVQQQSRGHVARLTQQAHEYATIVVNMIREKENDINKKVVLLLDS
ncbi:MAG: hypothetical protein ABSC14_05925, partial [Desulfomonilia bacterium]